MAEKSLYKVVFFNQGKVYEIYARSVSHGGLYGFVEIERLVFGDRAGVVVDPSEERLKDEFAGVIRSYIPLHAVVRIDQVEKQGSSKITSADGKVMPFPQSAFLGGGAGDKGSDR